MFQRKYAGITLIVWIIAWSIWALVTLGFGGLVTMLFMVMPPVALAIVATEERCKHDN